MAEIALRDRIYKSKEPPRHTQELASRPPSYKNWNEQCMTAACQVARSGQMSQRRTAEEYGIPRSTLGDHYRGKLLPGATSGRSKISH